MKCPACKEPSLVISERSGIEIDYCPDCRGIWLDRGELDKILERSRANESAARGEGPDRAHSPKYDDDDRRRGDLREHYDRDHKPYKRKKSFLEEIFD